VSLCRPAAVKKIWHLQDSQGQILALAFRRKCLKSFEMFPVRSVADLEGSNFFTEMCSGSEAGSYLRLLDFVYHSTQGLRVIKDLEGAAQEWLGARERRVALQVRASV